MSLQHPIPFLDEPDFPYSKGRATKSSTVAKKSRWTGKDTLKLALATFLSILFLVICVYALMAHVHYVKLPAREKVELSYGPHFRFTESSWKAIEDCSRATGVKTPSVVETIAWQQKTPYLDPIKYYTPQDLKKYDDMDKIELFMFKYPEVVHEIRIRKGEINPSNLPTYEVEWAEDERFREYIRNAAEWTPDPPKSPNNLAVR